MNGPTIMPHNITMDLMNRQGHEELTNTSHTSRKYYDGKVNFCVLTYIHNKVDEANSVSFLNRTPILGS